jgi:hypothetical protein
MNGLLLPHLSQPSMLPEIHFKMSKFVIGNNSFLCYVLQPLQAARILVVLICKHEFDARYQKSEDKLYIAQLYFPLIGQVHVLHTSTLAIL